MAAEWYIFLQDNYQRLSEWEHTLFEAELANNSPGVEYTWSYQRAGVTTEDIVVEYTRYIINFVTMEQTNMVLGTTRPLLRLLGANGHRITSPYSGVANPPQMPESIVADLASTNEASFHAAHTVSG